MREIAELPQQKGKRFEDEIEAAAEVYEMQGIAIFEKNDVPAGVDKRGKFYFKKKKGFDFFGVDKRLDGKCIVFEAKNIKDRLCVRMPQELSKSKKEKDGLQAHQLEALLRWDKMKAWAFVLWKNERGVFRIDPQYLEQYVGYGHSVSAVDIECEERFGFPIRKIKTKNGILDYLEAL